MKALNAKERNSAIIRFSLWLFICVVLICSAITFVAILPTIKKIDINSVTQEELAKLKGEIRFLQDTLAVQVRSIKELEDKALADKSKIPTCNLELMNIVKTLEADTAGKSDWRIEMSKNICSISRHLMEANESYNKSDEKKSIDMDKLNDAIIELHSVYDSAIKMLDYKSTSTLHGRINQNNEELKKVIRSLESIK